MTYDAEMPYTMFFTEDSKAIHGTKRATVRSYMHAYFTQPVGSQGLPDSAKRMPKRYLKGLHRAPGSISWKKNRMTEVSLCDPATVPGGKRSSRR